MHSYGYLVTLYVDPSEAKKPIESTPPSIAGVGGETRENDNFFL